MQPSPEDIEQHREFWRNLARENDWYHEPFYVQVWYRESDGAIVDSVSTRDLDRDWIEPVGQEY